MRVEELAGLKMGELEHIRNKNLVFFNVLTMIDLIVFYYSLHKEHWVPLFISLGVFIAGLSLYDNYRIARNLILGRQ